jgi:carbon monoxide dehydrogenase subunit G
MCTYQTEQITIDGSGKGASGWFGLTSAQVYVDHPVHAQYAHTLNIDFTNPGAGPSARVAVELTEEAARALADAINAALAAAPPGLASATQ